MGRNRGIVDRVASAVADGASKLVAAATTTTEETSDRREHAVEFAENAVEHLDLVLVEENRAAYEAAQLARVDTFGGLPGNADGYTLRFADGATFLTDVIEVDRDDFVGIGERASYAQKVDFAPQGAPARVSEAWLIAPSGEAVCCDLGGVPLVVGGGHQAQIPAGHLLF